MKYNTAEGLKPKAESNIQIQASGSTLHAAGKYSRMPEACFCLIIYYTFLPGRLH